MEIEFLGGAREVGRSAILVNGSLLLDYGIGPGNPPRYPVGSVDPDAVVISHGHLDHAGAVPMLLSGSDRPPIHWTPPTEAFARMLARDTLSIYGGRYDCPFTEEAVKSILPASITHGYHDPFEAAGHRITLHPAGHIPGSAMIEVDDGETTLLYTADYHPGEQRLVAHMPTGPAADADVVITESTYADRSRPDRTEIETSFVRRVEDTLWNGGTVVAPAFAIGRTQELMHICADAELPCYVDGLGIEVTRLLQRHPRYIRNADALDRAARHARIVSGRDGQRRRIADTASVIITTAGMLTGGPAMTYIPAVADDPTNLIALTGFQVPDTPGRELLDTGRVPINDRIIPVSAAVEAFDFSAHADRDGLLALLEDYRGAQILVVHGDMCDRFAESLCANGFTADAPELGDAVTVGPAGDDGVSREPHPTGGGG